VLGLRAINEVIGPKVKGRGINLFWFLVDQRARIANPR
jgi:hypothetical protein